MTLGAVYTLAEAAERLRVGKNALARLARHTGHCSATGRSLLFSEADLVALWQALRVRASSVTPIQSDRSIEQRANDFLAGKRRLE